MTCLRTSVSDCTDPNFALSAWIQSFASRAFKRKQKIYKSLKASMNARRYVKGRWEVSRVEVRGERRIMSCDLRGVVVGENADENVVLETWTV